MTPGDAGGELLRELLDADNWSQDGCWIGDPRIHPRRVLKRVIRRIDSSNDGGEQGTSTGVSGSSSSDSPTRPGEATDPSTSHRGLALTEEQLRVIRSNEDRLRVHAYAGAGKTTTLEEYARARPDTRFLYVAFNRSVRQEAENRFPDHVEPRTSHSIAYRTRGRPYKNQLTGSLRLRTVRSAAVGSIDYREAGLIRQTLRNYLVSGDEEIVADHLPPTDNASRRPVLKRTRRLFERMSNPADRDVPMVHDGYLKLYQLDRPDLQDRWDAILYDEAQDLNPVTHALFLDQPMPIVMVGDPHQQIYRFRGAVDAMRKFEADRTLYLSRSFRFGEEIARLCNRLLNRYKNLEKPIRGNGNRSSIQRIDEEKSFTILHRTFAGTFDTAASETRRENVLHWVGGLENYDLDRVEDVFHLYSGHPERIDDYRLKSGFTSYEEYRTAAKKSNDQEMLKMCAVVEKYTDSIPRILTRVKNQSVREPARADRILSTAHRAKGKEWEQVELAGDFPDPNSKRWEREMSPAERRDEVNLYYVAMTRARTNLKVPEFFYRFIRSSPERPEENER